MHDLADIFEPITPWGMPLVAGGMLVIVVCIGGAWALLHRRKNPIIQSLKSLDITDSKHFAKEFSALVCKARAQRLFKAHTLALLEEFAQNLAPYKFAKNPPPLDSLLITQYQHICEIL